MKKQHARVLNETNKAYNKRIRSLVMKAKRAKNLGHDSIRSSMCDEVCTFSLHKYLLQVAKWIVLTPLFRAIFSSRFFSRGLRV